MTRLKGDAILPNGWKLSDMGDCFLGGSGTAGLSFGKSRNNSPRIAAMAPAMAPAWRR